MAQQEKRRLSAKASAENEQRRVSARRRMLDELALVVSARGGEMTLAQADIVGVLVYGVTGADPFVAALAYWCDEARAELGLAEEWLRSRGGLEGLEMAAVGADEDSLSDYTIAQVVEVFAISDTEADLLGLTTLVSERRRSHLRRRAEGVPTAEEVRAAPGPKPWEVEGIPERTWRYRRAAEWRRCVEETVAAVRRIARGDEHDEPQPTADAAAPSDDRKPWEKLGVSRATYMRRKAAERTRQADGQDGADRETPPCRTRDPISKRYNKEFFPDRVAGSARVGLTRPAAQPEVEAVWHTAESRRLAALATSFGLTLSEQADPDAPWHAWEVPPGLTLTDEQAAHLHAARKAADAAERRRLAILLHRDRQRWAAMSQAERDAERAAEEQAWADRHRWIIDGDGCPRQVTPEVWAEIPRAWRKVTLTWSGRFHVRGEPGDRAVLLGFAAAMRAVSAYHEIRRALPDMSKADAKRYADWLYRLPTLTAVDRVRTIVQDRQDQTERAAADVAAAVGGVLPPVPDDDHAEVIARATKRLLRHPYPISPIACLLPRPAWSASEVRQAIAAVRADAAEARRLRSALAEVEAVADEVIAAEWPAMPPGERERVIGGAARLLVSAPYLGARHAMRHALAEVEDEAKIRALSGQATAA